MILTTPEGLYADPVLVLEPGRHTTQIMGLDADRNGRFLVTASLDKTVRIWFAQDGRLLRAIRLPAGPGDLGKAYAVAISPDGDLVATGGWTSPVAGDESIYIFARLSGELLFRVPTLTNCVVGLAFSPDGSRLAATLAGKAGVHLLDIRSGEILASDGRYGDSSYGLAFDIEGRIATASWDGNVRLYDPDLVLLDKSRPRPDARPHGIAFSPDGKKLAIGYDNKTNVDVLEAHTLNLLFEADTEGVNGGDLSKVAWSSDGLSLYAGGRWPADGGEARLREWLSSGKGTPADRLIGRQSVKALRPLPHGRLAFATGDPRLGLLGSEGREAWAVEPATVDFSSQHGVLAVASNGMRVRFGYEREGGAPAVFSVPERRLAHNAAEDGLATAKTEQPPGLIRKFRRHGDKLIINDSQFSLDPDDEFHSYAFLHDRPGLVVGRAWTLLALLPEDHKPCWWRPAPSAVWSVVVSGDGRFVVAAYGDGTIRWHRLSDGEELLAFYPDGDRERWVLWTPQGHYDASPGAEDLIGWHVDRGREKAPEFYTASRFSSRFRRPDVIDLVLQQLDVDRAVSEAEANTGGQAAQTAPVTAPHAVLGSRPPIIAIIRPQEGAPVPPPPGELDVTYTADAPEDDPATLVRALVDGELAGQAVISASAPTGLPRRLIVTVPSGASFLTLEAQNSHGWSDRAILRFSASSAAAPPATMRQPTATLYLLAIGINEYEKYPELKLDYAVADAEDFCNALIPQEGGPLYRRVKVLPLLDTEATLKGMAEGFHWLGRKMEKGDVTMVLLAGHGRSNDRGHFFFLPHEVDLGDPLIWEQRCIAHWTITSTLQDLAGRGKTLLFLDACHAGGVVGGPPNLRAISNDLLGGGVITFASCASGQVSLERACWKNGAMTEALLEGFAGKAWRSDDCLRVSDLADYIMGRVRELTEGAQTPEVLYPPGRYTNPPIYSLRR